MAGEVPTLKPGNETTEQSITMAVIIGEAIVIAVALVLVALGKLEANLAVAFLGALGIGANWASGKYAEARGNAKAAEMHAQANALVAKASLARVERAAAAGGSGARHWGDSQ